MDDDKLLLDSVLYTSAIDIGARIPRAKEYVLSEIVNATIALNGGKSGEVLFQNYFDIVQFEDDIQDYFNNEMSNRKLNWLNQTVGELIKLDWIQQKLTKGLFKTPARNLYIHFDDFWYDDNIQLTSEPASYLPLELIDKIEKQEVPLLSENQRKDMIELSKAMQPFLRQDLQHIQSVYGRRH